MKSILGVLVLILIFSCHSNQDKGINTIEGSSGLQGKYYASDSVPESKGESQDCISKLINAAKENNLKLAEELLEEGCDVNGKIEIGDNLWESPLRCGVTHNNSEMAKLLLKYGADPVQYLGRGMNPFQYAAGASSHETFLLLLNRCKDVNILNSNENYRTPLFFAIAEGKYENVKSLIERGAKINPDSLNGMSSPLADACIYNQIIIFKFLLMKGAKVNALYSSESEDCMPCLSGITVLHQLVDLN